MHGDLRLPNVVVINGHIKLIDFGFAEKIDNISIQWAIKKYNHQEWWFNFDYYRLALLINKLVIHKVDKLGKDEASTALLRNLGLEIDTMSKWDPKGNEIKSFFTSNR